jgi:hypothetical protein
VRPEALVFLHVLAAATLLGALLAVAVLSTAGDVATRLASRSAVLVLGATFATVAIGEAARAREDATGFWLDVGSMLTYLGLLFPSIGLVVLTRRTGGRAQLRRWVAVIALAMAAVALAATFVMAAKPR